MRLLALFIPFVALVAGAISPEPSAEILAHYHRVHPVSSWDYDWTTAIFLYGLSDSGFAPEEVRRGLVAVEPKRPVDVTSPDLSAMSLAANAVFDRSRALTNIVEASKKFFLNEPLNAGGVFDHVGHSSRLNPWVPPTSWIVPSSVWADSSIMYAANGWLIAVREHDVKQQNFFSDQLEKIHRYLWDSHARLYKHAYYFGSKTFAPADGYWARGNLWMALAFLKVAETSPAGTPTHDRFVSLFKSIVSSLSLRADPRLGLQTLLLQPENSYETTASALLAYVTMRGARLGYLDAADGVRGRALASGLRSVLRDVAGSPGDVSVTGISCPTTATTWTWYYTHMVRECSDESYGVGAYLMMLGEELRK